MTIRLGICGFGYWGPNLFRVFSRTPDFEVVAVSDRSPAARDRVAALNARVTVFDDGIDLVRSPMIDAVAIATPVDTHFDLAAAALKAGKHVLVEKPLCSTSAQAAELIALAEHHHAVLLVDHVYVFHDAVRKIKGMVETGEIGTISYYDTIRINLGLFQPDVNVMWDLAPHDFAIVDYLFGQEPIHVEATGYCHLNPDVPDIAYVTVHYPNRMIAHLNLSWMSPVKVRRTAIGGSRLMAVWDDLDPQERLKFYNSGIESRPEEERRVMIPSYRIGDIFSPRLPGNEALFLVAAHFGQKIKTQGPSPIDGAAGLRIMRLLEASQASLQISLGKANAAATRPQIGQPG